MYNILKTLPKVQQMNFILGHGTRASLSHPIKNII